MSLSTSHIDEEINKLNNDYLKDKAKKNFKMKILYVLESLMEPLERNPKFKIFIPNYIDFSESKKLSFIKEFNQIDEIYCLGLGDLQDKVKLLFKI